MKSIKSGAGFFAASFLFIVLFMPSLTPGAGSCDTWRDGNTSRIYIEAENFTETIKPDNANGGIFVVEYRETNGEYRPGSGHLRSSGGSTNTTCADLKDEGKKYRVNFTERGTYKVWIRGYAEGSGSDSVFIGLDNNCIGALKECPDNLSNDECEQQYYGRWKWTDRTQNGVNTFDIQEPGERIFNIWIREDRHLTDAIYLTKGPETPVAEPQCYGCPTCSINTGPTIKIMPLGDSITYGIGSCGACDNGYRGPLYRMLRGYNISFVGSRIHGDTCDFDRLHEGYPGAKAEFIRDNVADYLTVNKPDIVLLHIGTNNINSSQSAADIVTKVGQILDNIRQASQTITVVLALIVNQAETINGAPNPKYAKTTDFNNRLDTMARSKINAGHNIIIVDMEKKAGIDYRIRDVCGLAEENRCDQDEYHLADKLHPNDCGYEKMAEAWFRALLTDPRLKQRNDVVFLLDGSGSMLREGKWETAKDASVLFYDLMKALRRDLSSFEDRYGTVIFRCIGGQSSCTTVPVGSGLQNVSVPFGMDTFNNFTPLSHYSTPIGEGLKLAGEQFPVTTAEGFSTRTILLLSDGKHNCSIDPAIGLIPQGLRVQSVGLGEDEIDEEPLRDIARNSGGKFYRSESPRKMEADFIEILVNTSPKLQNVPVKDDDDSDNQQTMAAFIDQSKAAFIAVWDDTNIIVDFELAPHNSNSNITPQNPNLTAYPSMLCSYNRAGAGETHSFYVCDNIPHELLGSWRFVNIRKDGTPFPVNDVLLKVVIDPQTIAEFDFEKRDHFTGQPMTLNGKITEDGIPKTGLSGVYAELIRSPAMSAGTLMAENSPSPDHPRQPSANVDETPRSLYLSGVMKKLNIEHLSTTDRHRIALSDNGLNGDLTANDGIYTGKFNNTQLEGSYTFTFRARGTNKDGITFDRTETISEYVKFAPSPADTEVTVVSIDSDLQENMATATVRVTPRDSFGSYMGPFKGDLIEVWSSTGHVMTGYDDNLNGSYSFRLTYRADSPPLVSASVRGVTVEEDMPIIPARRSFSLHAGVTIPVGSFNNDYDSDYSIALNFDYHLNQQLSLVGLLGYNHFKSSSSSVSDLYWLNISANAKYELATSPLRPYVNGGPGVYIPERGSTAFGINAGLGVDYPINVSWTIELGADYHHIFTSGSDTQFIVPHVGLLYRF